MKRASTWSMMLLLGGSATSCRSLLDTDVQFEDSDDSSSSSSSSGPSSSTSSTTTTSSSSSSGGGSSSSSSGTSSGGGGSSSSSSSSAGGSGGFVCPGGDPFDGPELSPCWTESMQGAQTRFEDQQYVVTPAIDTGWWDEAGPEPDQTNGYRLHQTISDPFVASVHLDVDLGTVAGAVYQMGGMLFRNPRVDAPEEWIKWEVGQQSFGDEGDGSLAAVNNSGDSAAHLFPHAFSGNFTFLQVDLGACRGGPLRGRIFLAYRLDGDPWTAGHEAGGLKGHPVLDTDLEVGLIANAYAAQAGIVVAFDDFRIDTSIDAPDDMADCLARLEILSPPSR